MFANFNYVFNSEDFWGSVKNGVTRETARSQIKLIVNSSNVNSMTLSTVTETFEGKCARDELKYAENALRKMIDKCNSDIKSLNEIGGAVKSAISERNDAIQGYNIALERVRKAIEIVAWCDDDDELY